MPSSSFEGIRIETTPSVYFPREDSFMLAQAVKKFARGKVLDMGTGSGLQAITAAKNPKVTNVTASDVSATAVQCAENNAKENQCDMDKIKFIKSNLFENIPRRDTFETIIFNPPYLPAEENEPLDEQSAAWHGGKDGRKILEPFLGQFSTFLAPRGLLLLVQSSLNEPDKTISTLAKLGFQVEIVEQKKFFFEELFIYKATKLHKL